MLTELLTRKNSEQNLNILCFGNKIFLCILDKNGRYIQEKESAYLMSCFIKSLP